MNSTIVFIKDFNWLGRGIPIYLIDLVNISIERESELILCSRSNELFEGFCLNGYSHVFCFGYLSFEHLLSFILGNKKNIVQVFSTTSGNNEESVIHSNLLRKILGLPYYKFFEVFANKFLQRFFLGSCGIKSSVISSFNSFSEIEFPFPIVIKPFSGSGSKGIFYVGNTKELLSLRSFFSYPVLVESFVDGQLASIDFYVDEQGNISMCSYPVYMYTMKDLGVNDFGIVECGISNWFISSLDKNSFNDFLNEVIKQLDIRSSFIHLEFKVLSSSEFAVIEVNGRIGGSRYKMNNLASNQSLFYPILDQDSISWVRDKPLQEVIIFRFFPRFSGRKLIRFNETIGKKFQDMDSFFSISLKKNEIGNEVRFAKFGGRMLGLLYLANSDGVILSKDREFVLENYFSFTCLSND